MRATTLSAVVVVSVLLAAASPSAADDSDTQVPKSDHNPQGDPDVERGWQQNQDDYRRRQDDHDRSETDAGHHECPDDAVCSDQSTYKNRPSDDNDNDNDGDKNDDPDE